MYIITKIIVFLISTSGLGEKGHFKLKDPWKFGTENNLLSNKVEFIDSYLPFIFSMHNFFDSMV